MSSRNEIETRYTVDGRPVIVKLINNPVIDDILNTEARVYASSLETGQDLTGRRVDRQLRDFLIRIGVER